MTVTSSSEGGVPGPAGRVVLYRDTRPIEKGVAQAPIVGAPA